MSSFACIKRRRRGKEVIVVIVTIVSASIVVGGFRRHVLYTMLRVKSEDENVNVDFLCVRVPKKKLVAKRNASVCYYCITMFHRLRVVQLLQHPSLINSCASSLHNKCTVSFLKSTTPSLKYVSPLSFRHLTCTLCSFGGSV